MTQAHPWSKSWVGMVMLTAALLGTAGLALRTTIQGREDLQLWGAAQGRTVSGTNPQRIDLLVDRLTPNRQTVQDTVLLYLRN